MPLSLQYRTRHSLTFHRTPTLQLASPPKQLTFGSAKQQLTLRTTPFTFRQPLQCSGRSYHQRSIFISNFADGKMEIKLTSESKYTSKKNNSNDELLHLSRKEIHVSLPSPDNMVSVMLVNGEKESITVSVDNKKEISVDKKKERATMWKNLWNNIAVICFDIFIVRQVGNIGEYFKPTPSFWSLPLPSYILLLFIKALKL